MEIVSDKESGVSIRRLQKIWAGMKDRCCNERSTNFSRYGARGVSVCEEWRESSQPFVQWSLENGYNDALSIDRIDNDGNYEPTNCRWATRTQQAQNRPRWVRSVSAFGEAKILTEWAADARCKVKYITLVKRLNKGWSVEQAISTPPDPKFVNDQRQRVKGILEALLCTQ